MQLGFNGHSGTAKWLAKLLPGEVQFSGLVLTNEARAVGVTKVGSAARVDSASLQIWVQVGGCSPEQLAFLEELLESEEVGMLTLIT